jgi:hypothetical protein
VGREYDAIDEHLRDWIAKQPLFFVATAPASLDGHVNLSPKGPIGMLRVLGPHRIAYLDLVGSGAETLAHVRENGRIVVMLCAFEGPPRIVRLHGGGRAVLSSEPGFDALRAEGDFGPPEHTESQRAIVVVDVSRIADSCGYGVPLMRYEGRRPHMDAWAGKKLRVGGAAAIEDYKRDRNAVSIDGLPAFDPAPAPHA